jgi:hypothetical protein
METTLISPDAVRELLFNSAWTYLLDLELSPKFWDSDRALPSDDCNFDRLARHMGIPRDTLIEDLRKRTQRLLDAFLDPQKATKINSEKIIFPEALNVWMVRQGWSYDANELCFAKRDCGVGIVPKLTALNVPRPASDPYFRKLAENVGTPHAEIVETLYELSQEFLKSAQIAAGPEEPKANRILISAEAITGWLSRNGWVETSVGGRTCWVQRSRPIAEFQSILEHLQRFHGPYVTAEDITAFLHPKIEFPDTWITADMPLLEMLSRQTKTPLDQLITALRERTENTDHHG